MGASISEGKRSVISVTPERVVPANEGKLLHTCGNLSTSQTITDPDFQVTCSNSVRLQREVEMFQWVESKSSKKERKLGGSEVTVSQYSYHKEWRSRPISSSSFKESGHDNPASFAVEDKYFAVTDAKLGAFTLTEAVLSNMDSWLHYDLPATYRPPHPYLLYTEQTPNSLPVIYKGKNPQSPQVGDLRITYNCISCVANEYSVLAKQTGSSLSDYIAKSGGQSLTTVQIGRHTPEAMLTQMEGWMNLLTWIFRIVSWMLMFAGLAAIFRPIVMLADTVPFLGDLVGLGTGIFAFTLGTAFTLVVTALGWIVARPLLGGGMLLTGLIFIGFAFYHGRQSKT